MLEGESAVDVGGLAVILRCSRDKIYRMARSGDIPAFRVGSAWRFFPSEVRDRLTEPGPVTWRQSPQSRGRKRVR